MKRIFERAFVAALQSFMVLLIAGCLLGIPLGLMGFQLNFHKEIDQNQRGAGATGLGATNILFRQSDLGFRPLGAEVINDGDNNVKLGVRYAYKGTSADSAYYPTIPAGTSLDVGGAPMESVWVSDAGTSTTADTLYWTVGR